MLGHRKGLKNRPACQAGKIKEVSPGPDGVEVEPQAPAPPAHQESPPIVISGVHDVDGSDEAPADQDVDRDTLGPSAFELRADDQIGEDPEAMARQFNLEKAVESVGSHNGHNGADGSIGGADLPPGDWQVEQPDQPQVSQAREVVSLPWFVRGMYDWARAKGWYVGDGTISAFVGDCLIDHFTSCWGKAIVVVDRDQVQLVTK